MARYILLRVESNDTADSLIERFKAVPAIKVLGLFASATRFCECSQDVREGRRLRRNRKMGTMHCSVCKLPASTVRQTPRNLLNPPELHPIMNDIWLTVWEPYIEPIKKYGAEAIDRKARQTADARAKLLRHRRRRA